MIIGTQPEIHRPRSAEGIAQHLVELATRGLPAMFDQGSGLFCYSLKRTDQGLAQDGISRRYTIITLLGLHRLEESGTRSPIEIYPVLEGLLANLEWVDNIGDLGLLLWLCAVMAPKRLAEVERRIDVEGALNRYRDTKQGRTMELAWFLSGLAHWGLACPEKLNKWKDLAYETYRILGNNQGAGGFFGHGARSGSVSGRIRGWIGSFADQVYPIYAMTKLSQAYQDGAAAQRALDCGLRLCDHQGPLGQWFWHYDSAGGGIVEEYPVFSVHQHAMGPMVLFALGEAVDYDFTPWIDKGLRWINGENELAFDMENSSANLVWRCMFRPGLGRYSNPALIRGTSRKGQSRRGLKVLFECRPYELGWLLYAFAARSGYSKADVAVSEGSSTELR
jgi:hypothetical protein